MQRGKMQIVIGQCCAHRQIAQEIYTHVSQQFDELIISHEVRT